MKTKDFRGFRFGNIHTSDLNLEVVSSSGKYENRTLPSTNDSVVDVPGGDGQYYFGSVYKNREFTCNVAFDNVSEKIYRKMRQVFSTDKLQDLVFDEEPYKTWKAKLKGKPEFKSICFINNDTGERVYKGDGKLTFILYFPYALGKDKYIVRAADYYITHTPVCIINKGQKDETFVKNDTFNYSPIDPDVKYHYNVSPSNNHDPIHNNKDYSYSPNDGVVWKTGFPTTEQV